MPSIITPNMNLVVPVAGQESGPQYAIDVNASLTTIDQHNHTSGNGIQIPTAGININADLPINGYNLTLSRTLRFQVQGSTPVLSTDKTCLYVTGVDLYYIDGAGNNVRITQSGGIAGAPGTIANLTSPASASYVSASSTFVWQSDTNTAANLDAGSLLLRNLTASSNAITLSPPSSLPSNYTITLPALPSSLLPVTIDTSGNLGTISYNSIASNMSNPHFGGIPTIGTGPYSLLSTVRSTQDHQPALLRVSVASDGSTSVTDGGISVSHPSTGTYNLSFTFTEIPTVVATINTPGPLFISAVIPSSTGGTIFIYSATGGVLTDAAFTLIVVGLTT